MPVSGLLIGGFGAKVFEFADGFFGFDLSFHRFSSLKVWLVELF
jgi:hypothetical protein